MLFFEGMSDGEEIAISAFMSAKGDVKIKSHLFIHKGLRIFTDIKSFCKHISAFMRIAVHILLIDLFVVHIYSRSASKNFEA